MEFDFIKKYFQRRHHGRNGVVLAVGDDCALLTPPAPGKLLVMTTDTITEGVHYFADTDPRAIGHKALAVSLSDIASMGAMPAWVMLSLNLEKLDEEWMDAFSDGFFNLIERFQMVLIGGNTSSASQNSITTQVTGFIDEGKALLRSGAQPGDQIYVTKGHLGDPALAVAALNKEIDIGEHLVECRKSLDYPSPRVPAGLNIRDIATSAIDVSDGLAADLGHILEESNVGATIHLENIPISPSAKALIASGQLTFETVMRYSLAGGDDYEICFTIPADKVDQLKEVCYECGYQHIGKIESTPGLRLRHEEEQFKVDKLGFEHF